MRTSSQLSPPVTSRKVRRSRQVVGTSALPRLRYTICLISSRQPFCQLTHTWVAPPAPQIPLAYLYIFAPLIASSLFFSVFTILFNYLKLISNDSSLLFSDAVDCSMTRSTLHRRWDITFFSLPEFRFPLIEYGAHAWKLLVSGHSGVRGCRRKKTLRVDIKTTVLTCHRCLYTTGQGIKMGEKESLLIVIKLCYQMNDYCEIDVNIQENGSGCELIEQACHPNK